MARKYTTPNDRRKRFQVTVDERNRLASKAAAQGTSSSALLGAWLEDFIKNGIDLSPVPEVKVAQIEAIVEREIVERAAEKAKVGYGLSLLEVIRHKINQ